MMMTTDAANDSATTAKDSHNNKGKEAPPDREQHTTDNMETAVMMTPKEVEGWKTYISKKTARQTKKKKEREETLKKREEQSKEETESLKAATDEKKHTKGQQKNKGREKTQEEKEKTTRRKEREIFETTLFHHCKLHVLTGGQQV